MSIDIMGKKFTEDQLKEARIYAAKIHRRIAAEVFTADYYAPHVTLEDKLKIQQDRIKQAEAIERGDLDQNFTVAQRMVYFLTGESIPLISKPSDN